MQASYINSSSFSVEGNVTNEWLPARRVKLDCGIDGICYATIIGSTFNVVTTVTIDETNITSNLQSALYSVVKPGTQGNLPLHYHSTVEGDGGPLSFSFLDLNDTPTTYSGTVGKFSMSTGSGIVWSEIETTFLSLTDTLDVYTADQYLRTTSSGVTSVSGIVLKAPNGSEWMLRVTDTGVLYTDLY